MRTRLILNVLGLSALVLSVMATGTAGVAQAETGACFGYKSGATLPCFSASLEAEPRIAPFAKLLVGSKNIEIGCLFAAFIEGGVLSANGSILLSRLEFGGCSSQTKTTLAALGACQPKDPVTGAGRIRTEKGVGLIVLHGGQPVVQLKPDTGTILVKIFLGEECAVGGELIVEGKLILQDTAGKGAFEAHAFTHFLQEFSSLQLMTVGGVNATIDGLAHISLVDPSIGFLEWAGKAA